MELLQTINKYIKEHPLQSDKKIAKRLKLNRAEVKEIRAFEQNKENVKMKTPFIKKLERETFFRNLQARINFFTRNPIFCGNAIYLNIFLLAILMRLVYMISLRHNPIFSIPLLDARYYLTWAQQILKEGWLGSKVFFTEPLYAYLLALFLKITSQGQFIMLGFQFLLGIFLPLIIYQLTTLLFNRSIAILAGLISAIYGPFIFYENLLLKTSMETFFLTLFVLVMIYVFRSAKIMQYLGCGFFLGLIVLLKGNTLIVFPLVIYFIYKFVSCPYKTKFLLLFVFTVGFLGSILPVTLRNYIVGKDFVLTNYSIGMVIYQGNWWDSDGSLLQPPFSRATPEYEDTDFYKMAEKYQGKPLKPSETVRFWVGKAVSEIIDNPSRWFYITGKKFLLLITRVELSDNYDYALYQKFIPILRFLPGFWTIASLGLTAIVLFLFSKDLRLSIKEGWVLDKEKKFILGILVSYGLLVLMGHVNARYRQPMIPFLIILSMVTLWYLFIKIKSREFIRVLAILLITSFFFFLTSVHLENFDFMTDANFYNNLGSYYMDRKEDAKAEIYFKKAVDVDKKFVWAYGNLFYLYLRHGESTLAKENLQEQIKLRPDDLGGYYNLKLFNDLRGKPVDFIQNRLEVEERQSERKDKYRYDPYFNEYMRVFKQKDYVRAQEYLEKSAQEFANPPNTLLNLAILKKGFGDEQGAKDILVKIIQKDPYFLVAKYNLANIYIKEKNYPEVASLLQDIYDFVPEYGDGQAWYYLAAAYINSKNYDAALPLVQGFIKKYESDPGKKEQVEKLKFLLVPASNKPVSN